MTDSLKNYGFVVPVIEADHYVFGSDASLPKIVIREDGQWDDFLPAYEAQADKYETQGCTVWGTENAEETLEKCLFGGEPNYDEAFTYNLVGIDPKIGGDPHKVAESIRHDGVILNRPLPDTLQEFMTPRPPADEDIRTGKIWAEENGYKHEWVFTGGVAKDTRTALMKENLTYSPLGISVTAWIESDGVYIDLGKPNNHWIVCYGWTDSGWKVFDSYDHAKKIVSYDHNIQFVKRYSLSKRQRVVPEKCGQRFVNWLKDVIKF